MSDGYRPQATIVTKTLITTFAAGLVIGILIGWGAATSRTAPPPVDPAVPAVVAANPDAAPGSGAPESNPAGETPPTPAHTPAPNTSATPSPAFAPDVDGLWPAGHLFVGVEGLKADILTQEWLNEFKPGGVVLRPENITDPLQLGALVLQIKQAVGLGTTLADPPLILFQDSESDLPRLLGAPPAPQRVAHTAPEQIAAAIAGAVEGRKQGIAVVLGPALNIAAEGPLPADASPAMLEERAGSVIEAALVYNAGLRAAGLLPVPGLFPGAGIAEGDAGSRHIPADQMDRLAAAMQPFKAAIDSGVPGILVGHVAVPGIDVDQPNRPASVSPKLLQLLLRNEWKYDGVIVANDISRDPMVSDLPRDEIVLKALVSGCDAVILLDADRASLRTICDTFVRLSARSDFPSEQLEASKRRLSGWRDSVKQSPPSGVPVAEMLANTRPLIKKAAPADPVPAPEVTPAETAPAETAPAPEETPVEDAPTESAPAPEETPAETTTTGPSPAPEATPAETATTEPTPATDANPAETATTDPAPAPEETAAEAATTELAPASEATPAEAATTEPTPATDATPAETATTEPMPATEEAPAEAPTAEDTPAVTEAVEAGDAGGEKPAQVIPEGTVLTEHTIAKGESLTLIANRYAVSLADLRAWNALTDDTIKYGQKLKVYTAGGEAAGDTPGSTPEPTPDTPVEAPDTLESVEPAPASPAELSAPLESVEPVPAPAADGPTPSEPVEAASAAAPPLAPPPNTRLQEHTVLPGETAEQIADEYGVALADVLAWNGKTAEALPVEVGATLRIYLPVAADEPGEMPVEEAATAAPPEPAAPAKTQPEPAEGAYEIHVVGPGDNLRRIAQRYGTTQQALIELNKIERPDHVEIGQKLKIPKATAPGEGPAAAE